METIMDNCPPVEGWYLCVDVDSVTLYLSPTLFTDERKAEDWRKRYEAKFPPMAKGKRRTVYLKPLEGPETKTL